MSTNQEICIPFAKNLIKEDLKYFIDTCVVKFASLSVYFYFFRNSYFFAAGMSFLGVLISLFIIPKTEKPKISEK